MVHHNHINIQLKRELLWTDDILTKVDLRTRYGQIYTISKEVTKAAIQQLKYVKNLQLNVVYA